jgi:hypothetical protein
MAKSKVIFKYNAVTTEIVVEHDKEMGREQIIDKAQNELSFNYDIDTRFLGEWSSEVYTHEE